MPATTSKKNKVVTFRTSDGGQRDKNAVQLEFRIEIMPDKEVGPITARDADGNEYDVSFECVSRRRAVCCCRKKNGKRICHILQPGEKCECRK